MRQKTYLGMHFLSLDPSCYKTHPDFCNSLIPSHLLLLFLSALGSLLKRIWRITIFYGVWSGATLYRPKIYISLEES
jgi:hypothetical protein